MPQLPWLKYTASLPGQIKDAPGSHLPCLSACFAEGVASERCQVTTPHPNWDNPSV